MIAQAPAPICVLHGPELVFELANELYHQVVGIRDLVGKPMLEAMPELRGKGIAERILEVMRTGVSSTAVTRPIRAEADPAVADRHYHVSYSPLRQPDGSIERVLVWCADVTEMVAARNKLEESEKRGQVHAEELARTVRFAEMFLGILGHDLRNPLSAITTAAGLLAMRGEQPAPVKRILSSADRMERMIDQLLDFTRIRLGRGLPLKPRKMDLREICQTLVDELSAARQVTIHLESLGDTHGTWDRDRLFQLLANLVSNACHHGTAGFPVRVKLDGTTPQQVLVSISNAGVIPDELQPNVFEPLSGSSEERAARRPRSSGLGLGLFISRQIVMAHGGQIGFTSEADLGTTFQVILPRQAASGDVFDRQPGK